MKQQWLEIGLNIWDIFRHNQVIIPAPCHAQHQKNRCHWTLSPSKADK